MKFTKTFLGMILALLTITSCSVDDDIKYSCNKTVDAWVKNNLSTIHQLNRNEWLQAAPSVSIAIYRAFTPQQRIQFWKDKMKEVESLNWSQTELSHIKKVEAFIDSHSHFFSGQRLTDEQLNELETFFYKWQKEGMHQFGWNEKVAVSIAGTGEKLKDTKGEILELSKSANAPAVMKSSEDCNCSTGLTSGFCIGEGPCEDVPCDGSDYGCGWLWLQDCNGICERY